MNGRVSVAAALALALGACSTAAPRRASRQPPRPAPVHTPSVDVAGPAPRVAQNTDTWQRLRGEFALDDCVAPAVKRAQRETRNRQGFEQHLEQLLPMIDFVARVADHYHVAGEMALLPWVESHYREVPPRTGRPAGMWQIMAITAHPLDLPMTHNYDGRLDPVAATGAVMKLLTRYYDTWHDWRLAGMAYNTGEYRLRAILKKHGKPPAKPVIPKLPVGRVTRQHLTRVLAIACIIRDPHRFHVTLPRLAPQRRLEVVQLKAPISFTQVAKVSGVSRGWLRRVNAGYRRARVTAGTPMQLLLPAPAARALRGAIASGDINDASGPASPASQGSYTVVRGDSLSRIAQRFHVSVAELRRWNQLKNSLLHPGQVLHLAPPSR